MRLLLVSALLVGMAACGTAAVPLKGNLPQTQSAIRAAEEVGAKQVPKAALHLKMAQDQLATAQALAADGEEEQASIMFARSESDAELALLLAREAKVRSEADAAQKNVDDLKKSK
jgi:hypothetical protein